MLVLLVIGEVITSDKKKSITKESLGYFMQGQQVGYAATGAVITGTGNTTVTLFTDVEHNLNQSSQYSRLLILALDTITDQESQQSYMLQT